ncbi:MAG: hypothetical protein U0234_16980 [Sandaracinus sp.]
MTPSFHPIALSSATLVAPWGAPSIVTVTVPWTGVVRRLHVLSTQFEVLALRLGTEADLWADAQRIATEGDVRTYAFPSAPVVAAGTTFELFTQNRGPAPAFFEAQLACAPADERPRAGSGVTPVSHEPRLTLRLADAAPTLRIVGRTPSPAPTDAALVDALADALESADLPRITWLAERLWASPETRRPDPRPVWRALARFAARRAAL